MTERTLGLALLALTLAAAPTVLADLAMGASAYESIHQGYPGPSTAIAGALLRGAVDLTGLLALGSVVLVLFLHPRPHRRVGRLREGPDLAVLTWSACAWTVLAVANVVVSAADSNGVPLSRLLEPGALGELYSYGYMPRAWTVTAVGAFILWICSRFATRWTTLLPGLWAGTVGALAPVVVGQLLVGPAHDIGGDAGVVQTVITSVLLGPVLVSSGLRTLYGPTGRAPRVDRHRLALLAAVGVPVAVLAEVVITWFKLAGSAPWESATGLLSLARIALLLALAAVLFLPWPSRRLPGPAPGLLLALWIGLGAAMTRIPPPQYFVPTSISQIFMGYEVPAPPTLDLLVLPGRLDILFATIGVTATAVYLAMVMSLRGRGLSWPWSRVLLWVAGWLVVVYATNSGFGKYSAADFGVHMVVHMSLSMLAPILLVQGGVVTLALRATRVDRRRAGWNAWMAQVLNWRLLRVLYHPAVVFVLFVGSYYALYFTPLFDTMMRFHWAHQLMNLHFLVTGYAYYSLIVGVDRPPRPLPHIGRLGYALAAMPFHAFLGVAIISSPTLFAETFYTYLDLPWADLDESQQVAGAVAWAGGEVPLIIAIVALCIQWARQDDKEARRRDRHFDQGLDHEFDAYNEMLTKLAERKDSR